MSYSSSGVAIMCRWCNAAEATTCRAPRTRQLN